MLRSTALGLALLLFAGWPACAQAIYPPINIPVFRTLDANSKPLSRGKLYTCVAGSFPVIKNNCYRCDVTNLINSAPDKWVETTFH